MPLVVLSISSLFSFGDLLLQQNQLLFELCKQALQFFRLLAHNLGIEATELFAVVHGAPALDTVLRRLRQTHHPADVGVALNRVLEVLA